MNHDNFLDVQETNPSLFTQVAQNHLLNSSKWALFLSIIGVITISLLILVFIFVGSTYMDLIADSPIDPNFGSGAIGFLLFLYLIIIGLPTWFLFQFARKTQKAISTQNSMLLESGLRYHKFFFMFYGIITAFFIALNLLGSIGLLFA